MPLIGKKKYLDLEDLEEDAKQRLSPSAYGYYASGAETESALRENKSALARLRLLPRCLVDVRRIDTSCEHMQRLCDVVVWHNISNKGGSRCSS